MQIGARWTIVTAGLLATSTANAYVPPSHYIIKNLAAKKKDFKGVRVRSLVTGSPEKAGDLTTAPHFRELTVYDYASHVLRTRAFDEAGRELFSLDRRLSGSAGKSSFLVHAVDALLFSSRTDQISRILDEIGVPVRTESELMEMKTEEARRGSEIESYSRWKGTVAWVVGSAKKPNLTSQLWVEKDSFLPLRLVAESHGMSLDVRFEGTRFFREFPFPNVVRAVQFKDGAEIQILQDEATEVVVNPPDLASELKSSVSGGLTAAGESSSSGLKDLINRYYELVR